MGGGSVTKRTSAAKAAAISAPFTARLKPCRKARPLKMTHCRKARKKHGTFLSVLTFYA
jgi:hypothetical protein